MSWLLKRQKYMQEILLSVIIPTRNRENLLKGTLQSIVDQTFPKEKFEVIVNDNGSTDNTKQVVNSFLDKIPNLTYHYDATPGLHNGRHNGYKLAKSEILVYADDDIEAFPTWLEGVWESFQDPKVMLVGGKNFPKWADKPPFWIEEKWYQLNQFGHCLADLSLIDFGDDKKEIPAYYVYGCNFSVRKTIITETKGFHPDGFPFDMVEYRGDGESYVDRFVMERKYKVLYNPKASVYHLVTKERLTIDYFKRREFRAGVEKSYIEKRYNEFHKQPCKLIRFKNSIRDAILRALYPSPQQTEIDKQLEQSRKLGYKYHNSLYQSRPSLREWVHKETYLND